MPADRMWSACCSAHLERMGCQSPHSQRPCHLSADVQGDPGIEARDVWHHVHTVVHGLTQHQQKPGRGQGCRLAPPCSRCRPGLTTGKVKQGRPTCTFVDLPSCTWACLTGTEAASIGTIIPPPTEACSCSPSLDVYRDASSCQYRTATPSPVPCSALCTPNPTACPLSPAPGSRSPARPHPWHLVQLADDVETDVGEDVLQ